MKHDNDPKYIHLPNELFAPVATLDFNGEVDLGTLHFESGDFTFEVPATYKINVTNAGEGMYVQGTVEGHAQTQCGRCLTDVNLDVTGKIATLFLFKEPELGEDEYCDDEVLPADHFINVHDLCLGAILMNLPNKVLCKPDCKGLCPRCGTNLNEGECNCNSKGEISDTSPFAALKDFKVED